MKQFNKTLSRYPRASQPEVREVQVFTQLESVRRRDEQFRSQHMARKSDLTGSSWNSLHLEGFLKSRESPPMRQRLHQPQHIYTNRAEHYFRTLRHDNNASKIGYTDVNPLASHPRVSPHGLDRFCSEVLQRLSPGEPSIQQNKLDLKTNSIRHKITNPLTFKNVPALPEKYLEAKRVRLLNLIQKQYPHGMMGIDNPDNAFRFYKQPAKIQRPSVIAQPMCNQQYELDREWKTKKRVPSPKQRVIYRVRQIPRRLSNASPYDYDIISNTQR